MKKYLALLALSFSFIGVLAGDEDNNNSTSRKKLFKSSSIADLLKRKNSFMLALNPDDNEYGILKNLQIKQKKVFANKLEKKCEKNGVIELIKKIKSKKINRLKRSNSYIY